MHIECVFIEIYLLKNKYLAEIIAYKKIKAFSPMQKTYNIGSTKFSFPFNIELLFHYVVFCKDLRCNFLHYLKVFSTRELNSGHAIFMHFVTLHHSNANAWRHKIVTKFIAYVSSKTFLYWFQLINKFLNLEGQIYD